MVGVDDRRYYIAAKGRTYLEEQILIGFARFLVVVVAYLESGAVGCEAALEG